MSSVHGEELEILVGAGGGGPEELILVGRPDADGRVRVRGWTGHDWGCVPEAREFAAGELVAELERAVRAGRALRPEIGAVRQWLAHVR